MVANIIHNGQWAIPDHVRGLVPHVCVDIEANEIGSGADEWIWSASLDGVYGLKATYNALRKKYSAVPWCRAIWFPKRILKHSFITWFAHRWVESAAKNVCLGCNFIAALRVFFLDQ